MRLRRRILLLMLLQAQPWDDDNDHYSCNHHDNQSRRSTMHPATGTICILLLTKRNMPCRTKMQERLPRRPLLLLRTITNHHDNHPPEQSMLSRLHHRRFDRPLSHPRPMRKRSRLPRQMQRRIRRHVQPKLRLLQY